MSRTPSPKKTPPRNSLKTASIAPAFAALLFAGLASGYLPVAQQISVTAERISDQPLIESGPQWAELGLFNPTAIRLDWKTVLLFRAQDRNHTSRIGYAESVDGIHFKIRPEPLLGPETDYEKGGGLEDPRLIKIGPTYYLTYTAYNLHDAQLCLATSTDLLHWQRKGVILPAYKGTWNTQWTKSGAIIGKKIQGKWWMYYLGTRTDADGKPRDYMGLAWSGDLLHWSDATDKPVLERRAGAFDSRVMEPGPAPFVTDRGILLLYNGANDRLEYGPGWVLFDRQDPRKVIARAERPFVLAKFPWEKEGNVPNVIFLEGAVVKAATESHGLQLLGYYGAADKKIGGLLIRIGFGGE